MTYLGTKGASFRYSNYDPKDGCYDVEVMIDSIYFGWRIWVSDENGDGADLDTKNSGYSKTRFCTKWLHVHVKKDGRQPTGHYGSYK